MNAWQNEILAEAAKLICRHETYARQLADEHRRRTRRTTAPVPLLIPRRPQYWSVADGFDPYLVRARCERIAHSIGSSIKSRAYTPFNPIVYRVPKSGGGLRDVSVFQVADNAISRRIFLSLMRKNKNLLSSRAYAYRSDVSAHDAIQFLTAELRGQARVFIAEYDFSKYFDNISHDYIWKTIQDRQFLITPAEKSIVESFLAAPAQNVAAYVPRLGLPRSRGVPQGTSISLFLANVAAWDLDRALERLGVSFVRYADDTLIWSSDYSQVCRAVESLHEMSDRIGAPLNLQKSGGVRLLTRPDAPAEIHSTNHVEYLGHSVSFSNLSIRERLLDKLRLRINKLVYFNLVREPLRRTQDPTRLGRVDKDYVTFIWQLRRYLYGDINEHSLRRLQRRGSSPRRFRGFMAFFPLVEEEQLKTLDRWILCQVCLALRKRAALLRAQGFTTLPEPHGRKCHELRNYTRKSTSTGGILDLRLPSLQRIGAVIRRAAQRHGVNRVARGTDYAYI